MKLFFYFPFFFGSFLGWENFDTALAAYPVEICDNALDDDADGLIDLNDTVDCNCPVALPQSLIPNPSFEEMNCCPQDRSELHCCKDWIQASEATTDYLHTCGWMGWPDLPPPLPFPDGEGCVGFRNGRVGGPIGGGDPQANWKEYAGACLLGPLKAGTAYRFEFWVGFTNAFHSPPTNIVFYGTADCMYLPFGVGNEQHGCPLNGPGWMELGALPISGGNQWKLMEISVTPLVDIRAIAIGPDCDESPPITSYYYFLDNLVLADVQQFNFKITASGNPCGEGLTLDIPDRDTLQYQWYKDGVALIGQTGHRLLGVVEEGEYQVRVLGPYSCRITPAYKHKIPVFTTSIDSTICRDEAVFFNQTSIAKTGQYIDTLQTPGGCDSIVTLNLGIAAEDTDTVFVKILESETYRLGNRSFTRPGGYDVVLTAANGCDSLVFLVLDFYDVFIPNAFSPNGDGFNDGFTLFAGDGLQEIVKLEIYDRWGGLVYRTGDLEPGSFQAGWDGSRQGKPSPPGVYVWQVTLVFDDGKQRELAGSVTLLR
ncbi:MAG: gliding motility-associated C-terminal domain-containing protein [Bacteroidetes bacterium]|nr:gliding motility-associated C-terminal domain-containing protein [Bacteroidota bacterium]